MTHQEASSRAGNDPEAEWSAAMAAGWDARRARNLNGAAEHYRIAARLAEDSGVSKTRLPASLLALGQVLCAQKQFAEANPLLWQAVAVQEATVGAEHPEMAPLLRDVAFAFCNQGKAADGIALLERAVSIREAAFGKDHPETFEYVAGLALLLSNAGRAAEAELLLQRVLLAETQTLGPGHYQVIEHLKFLALTCAKQGRFAETEALSRRVLVMQEQATGPVSIPVAETLERMADYHAMWQQQPAQAEPLYRRALAIYEELLEPENRQIGRCTKNLGGVLAQLGRTGEAESYFLRALAIQERVATDPRTYPYETINLANSLSFMGYFYTQQRRFAEAEPLLERALALQEQAAGPDDFRVACVLRSYAELMKATRRKPEAKRMEARAEELEARFEREKQQRAVR